MTSFLIPPLLEYKHQGGLMIAVKTHQYKHSKVRKSNVFPFPILGWSSLFFSFPAEWICLIWKSWESDKLLQIELQEPKVPLSTATAIPIWNVKIHCIGSYLPSQLEFTLWMPDAKPAADALMTQIIEWDLKLNNFHSWIYGLSKSPCPWFDPPIVR